MLQKTWCTTSQSATPKRETHLTSACTCLTATRLVSCTAGLGRISTVQSAWLRHSCINLSGLWIKHSPFAFTTPYAAHPTDPMEHRLRADTQPASVEQVALGPVGHCNGHSSMHFAAEDRQCCVQYGQNLCTSQLLPLQLSSWTKAVDDFAACCNGIKSSTNTGHFRTSAAIARAQMTAKQRGECPRTASARHSKQRSGQQLHRSRGLFSCSSINLENSLDVLFVDFPGFPPVGSLLVITLLVILSSSTGMESHKSHIQAVL